MPRMRVLSSYDWNGEQVSPGDEHEATDKEADILKALQWAEPARSIATKVMDAVTDAANAISKRTGLPKRQYRRRDMQASS